MIATMLDAFHERGEILDPPIAMDRWRDGPSYLIARQQRTARRLLQTGRQQIATRLLHQQIERLKQVWDAYRAATDD